MILYYIADEKIYCFDGKKTKELPSTSLAGYIDRVYQNAQAKEWKTGGSGARFTDTFDPYDATDRVQNIRVFTDCVCPKSDGLFFTQTIDGISGLYIKREGVEDGIVFSDNTTVYTDFDLANGEVVIAAEYKGESHIGICPQNSTHLQMLTEGESLDSYPTWSRFEDKVIYYSSAGFAIESGRAPEAEETFSPMGRMLAAQNKAARSVGPTALYRLDTNNREIEELISDDRFDFLRAKSDKDGNLYFIKKPYQPPKDNVSVFGCLLDILLFPFRLIRALLGFLNIFSMVYSGKAIRQSGSSATKNKDEKSLYLDGNMINAEKELKNNRKKGDKHPGIIPRTYELCKLAPNGEITVLKRGVVAYTLAEDGIYYSNGSAVLHLDKNRNETLITKAERVTQLAVWEGSV